MRFINRRGNATNYVMDVTQNGETTHKVSSIMVDGIHRVTLRDVEHRVVARHGGFKGRTMGEDDVTAWASIIIGGRVTA